MPCGGAPPSIPATAAWNRCCYSLQGFIGTEQCHGGLLRFLCNSGDFVGAGSLLTPRSLSVDAATYRTSTDSIYTKRAHICAHPRFNLTTFNLKAAFIYTDYSSSEGPESMRIIKAQRSRFCGCFHCDDTN